MKIETEAHFKAVLMRVSNKLSVIPRNGAVLSFDAHARELMDVCVHRFESDKSRSRGWRISMPLSREDMLYVVRTMVPDITNWDWR